MSGEGGCSIRRQHCQFNRKECFGDKYEIIYEVAGGGLTFNRILTGKFKWMTIAIGQGIDTSLNLKVNYQLVGLVNFPRTKGKNVKKCLKGQRGFALVVESFVWILSPWRFENGHNVSFSSTSLLISAVRWEHLESFCISIIVCTAVLRLIRSPWWTMQDVGRRRCK